MTTATLIKKTFNWGGSLTVPVHCDREHGWLQADVLLELRGLQATGSLPEVTLREAGAKETLKPTPAVTHFLQQATPSNSAIPFGGRFLASHHRIVQPIFRVCLPAFINTI